MSPHLIQKRVSRRGGQTWVWVLVGLVFLGFVFLKLLPASQVQLENVAIYKRNEVARSKLTDCAFGDNKWVAVGEKGGIYVCKGDESWHLVGEGVTELGLYCVTFANGLWVAGGEQGVIVTSPNAVDWQTTRIPSLNSTFYNILFENGTWVAFSPYGPLLTSTDGKNWKPTTKPSTIWIFGQVYGNGLWVAVGDDMIVTSRDGSLWTRVDNEVPTFSIYGPGPDYVPPKKYTYNSVAYRDGQWEAVAVDRTFARSSDGTNWRKSGGGMAKNTIGLPPEVVKFGNGIWVAAGQDGISVSKEGVKWKIVVPKTYVASYQDLAYENGLWIAIINGRILTSKDGLVWSHVKLTRTSADKISYLGGRWIAYGRSIATSVDGIKWIELSRPPYVGPGTDPGFYVRDKRGRKVIDGSR
ncbi:MAG: hypothetical protein K8R88_11570 [Armatimonadetes bacterium]|nr:hypothetical protein [Armatimonadota bacterium]